MRKKALVLLLLMLIFKGVKAQEHRSFYAALNPVAPFTSIPNQFCNLYLPLASNLETGISLSGGMKQNNNIYEIRLSAGFPNSLYSLQQIHTGYMRILKNRSQDNYLYCGSFIKYYKLSNRVSGIAGSNVIPYLCCGYRITKGLFFADLRLNQTIYAVSWSNDKSTSVNGDFQFSVFNDMAPVIPYLSINIGYLFNPSRGK